MIIVFFHVLYFLGKLFYKNYRSTDSSDNESVENTDEINVSTCGEGTSQLETSQYDPYSDFYDDNSTKIRFSPPAYIQRYASVTNILTDSKYTENIRKIVDFGCSELGFIRHLKNIKGVEEILCVDIDRNTLEIYKRKVEPLTSDYLVCRDAPLTINLYEGSVTQSDESLENCDAVVAIELIEHLYPDTLLDLPHNIFGFIQPQVAVFTTPNADFNVLFKGMSGFRHWDHKFEWTREQFQDWSHNIISRYPNYSVTFAGVCSGPPGSESLGHCSQMVIFHRESERIPLHGTPGLFKLIASSEYPYHVDTRSDEAKILDDATYYIRSYALNNEDEEMSLELLAKWMNDVSVTALKDVLESEGWTLANHEEKGISVMCQRYSDSSEYDIESVDIAYDSYNYADDSYNHAANVEEDWDSEPGPPVYRQEIWPEIHDQDEENSEELINEEHELPSVSVILASNLSVDSASPELSPDTSINRLLIDPSETHAERSGGSFNKTLDGSLLMETGLSEADMNQTFDASTLASICSMYLQSSSCENHEKALGNISNPEFQTSREFDESSSSIEDCRKKLQYSCEKQSLTSTPVDLRLGYYRRTSENEELDESLSSGTLERSVDKLRGSALMATFDEVEESENSGISEESVDKTGEFSVDDDDVNKREEDEVIEKRPLFLESLKEVLRERIAVKEAEEKGAEARESPLNSWSPEVMDSGYPNTSSGHDITPECDLSSIGNDKVSEEEFVGVDEAPRRQLEVEADGRVENGDLANNNRDGEGNNVDPVEENEFDDLQPIIDGLENDLENENDIYDFQNGFPVWLLRILDAEGAGGQPGGFQIGEGVAGADADNIQHDEGIDSSSSDNESENEEADENKNINKDENQQIDTSDEDNNDDIDKHDGELCCAKDA